MRGDCALCHPTNRTPELIRAAVRLQEGCYEERDWRRRPYRYRKAGVMLTELTKAGPEQGRLFVAPSPKADALLATVDELDRPVWGRRREHMSPRYTTRWDELVEARA